MGRIMLEATLSIVALGIMLIWLSIGIFRFFDIDEVKRELAAKKALVKHLSDIIARSHATCLAHQNEIEQLKSQLALFPQIDKWSANGDPTAQSLRMETGSSGHQG